jgi:hypothetical protein
MADDPQVYLTRRQQAKRYARSVRSIERMGDDPTLGFPPEIDVNGHKLRWLPALEVWERERAVVAASKKIERKRYAAGAQQATPGRA